MAKMIKIGNRSRAQYDIYGLPPVDPKTLETKVDGKGKPLTGAGPFQIKPTRPNKSGTLVMGIGDIPEDVLNELLDKEKGDDFTKGLFGRKGGQARLFEMSDDQVKDQIVAQQAAAAEDATKKAASAY